MNNEELAFEYALGTLRGEQRLEFERRYAQEPALATALNFWQQQLMTLQTPQKLDPHADTWARIAAQLDASSLPSSPSWRQRWLSASWWPTVFASVLLLITMWLVLPRQQHDLSSQQLALQPNADYVAVLTAPDGAAKLTALTTIDGQKLWLRWQATAPRSGYSLQLWAVSKRDGEARSLGVISQAEVAEISLDTATSRLIQDAAELLLTEEESGGSALDQPSESVIARGVCVRLRSG